MQNVPSVPSSSRTTYERIQRMSAGISSSPTWAERAAVAASSLSVPQPFGRRMTYRSISNLLLLLEVEAAFFLANGQFVVVRSPEPLGAGPPRDRAAARLDRSRPRRAAV